VSGLDVPFVLGHNVDAAAFGAHRHRGMNESPQDWHRLIISFPARQERQNASLSASSSGIGNARSINICF
jgi:hypothetical protein